jgi:hypothetical protein|tara:strand:- start:5417 stop:5671 length:255 start_codon:yes stop_codon:yes gene_type:complete
MIFLLPQVSSTFKGVSPSDLAEKWGDPTYGKYAFDLDVAISGEIMEQVMESQENAKGKGSSSLAGKAKGAVARREQRRERRRGG